jgi:hypothetical protein
MRNGEERETKILILWMDRSTIDDAMIKWSLNAIIVRRTERGGVLTIYNIFLR